MKIFTVSDGRVEEGGKVERFILSAGIAIPAILVGERGRGRQLGVLPVQLLPSSQKIWEEEGEVEIRFGSLGQTKSGKPKLLEASESKDSDALIVALEPIGFRGSNRFGGDWEKTIIATHDGLIKGWEEILQKKDFFPEDWEIDEEGKRIIAPRSLLWDEVAEISERLFDAPGFLEVRYETAPFPGEILVRGVIAQGTAGRMGSGEQLIFKVAPGTIWSIYIGGRRYGATHWWFYKYDGEKVISATPQERFVADLF